jgi:hypothetical protein
LLIKIVPIPIKPIVINIAGNEICLYVGSFLSIPPIITNAIIILTQIAIYYTLIFGKDEEKTRKR